MQDIFQFLSTIDPLAVYGLVLGIALIENLFPPAPSDVMIIAAGSLVGLGQVGFVETLLSATAGSTIGFVMMYKIGEWFGDHILEQGKIKFLPVESVHRVERWFVKYGYAIIVINRFLTGTRAVVSFFAGMSELRLPLTAVLCFFSALIWNAILISIGMYLGQNWEKIGFYLSTYSQGVTAVLVLIVIVWAAKVIFTKSAGSKKNE